MMQPTLERLLLTLLATMGWASGFVTPVSQTRITLATATTTTTSLNGWEDIVYNAESVAANLATISLKDASFSSFPILYGAGLLTSVSPCVWGLLPLTMSYISTAAGERGDKQATLPTLVFAAGLASVFCTLGIFAASVGDVFGAQNQQPEGVSILVSLLSSGVCLAMGLQLLEFVQLPLPSLELNVMDDDGFDGSEVEFDDEGNMLPPKPKGSLFRTFLLGGSSALVASPCATPVLTSILAFVSNSHNPLLGAFLLFGYTLGYSTPLLVVAATGGQVLANLEKGGDGMYGKIAPWVTPLTGGILLWYGTNGVLTAVFGDPSMAALAPILY